MRHFVPPVLGLVRACHPLPTLAVTAVAAGLAAVSGRPPLPLLVVTAAVFAGQLSVGWLNDVVDAGRDAAVGRTDKPIPRGHVSATVVLGGVFVAAPAAVLLSLPSGLLATGAHVVALISAWAYDLGVKATAASVLPYAVSFGLLPAFVVLGSPGSVPPVWLIAAGALLGCAAHFANALPDLADDVATGVRGLPHRLGTRPSQFVASALVLAASAVLVLGPPDHAGGAGLLVLVAAVSALGYALLRARRARSRAVFHAVLLIAVADVALLLAAGVSLGSG